MKRACAGVAIRRCGSVKRRLPPGAPRRGGTGASRGYSPLAILTALTLRAVFHFALRQTEGLIGSLIRLLGLDLPVPEHTTLSRRGETLEVPRPG
jgi:hypothetical protein